MPRISPSTALVGIISTDMDVPSVDHVLRSGRATDTTTRTYRPPLRHTQRVITRQQRRSRCPRKCLALFAGHRDCVDEDADFGVPPDREQHPILAGGTNNHYGATTISPADLGRLLAEQMFRQLETCLKDGHGTSLN
jgi:hypothetical protein